MVGALGVNQRVLFTSVFFLGSVLAGLGSGVAFMCCGFVTVWLNYSVVTTLVWLPGRSRLAMP